MVTFGTVNSTALTILSLSEGGGGWRKTFKSFLSKFWVPIEELGPHFHLISKKILGAFHKNKYHYGFNPDLENVKGTVPFYFFCELAMTHLEMGQRLKDQGHMERVEVIFSEIGADWDLAQKRKLLKAGPTWGWEVK
jgi:hypothetical protein